jgi:hypothetical protein
MKDVLDHRLPACAPPAKTVPSTGASPNAVQPVQTAAGGASEGGAPPPSAPPPSAPSPLSSTSSDPPAGPVPAPALGIAYHNGQLVGSKDGDKPSWRESTVACWYALAQIHRPRTYFSAGELLEYCETHWDQVCWSHAKHSQWKSMPRRVLQHHTQLSQSGLSLFVCAPDSGHFGLRSEVGGGSGSRSAGDARIAPAATGKRMRTPLASTGGEGKVQRKQRMVASPDRRQRALPQRATEPHRPTVSSPGVRVVAGALHPAEVTLHSHLGLAGGGGDGGVGDGDDEATDVAAEGGIVAGENGHLPPSKRLLKAAATASGVVTGASVQLPPLMLPDGRRITTARYSTASRAANELSPKCSARVAPPAAGVDLANAREEGSSGGGISAGGSLTGNRLRVAVFSYEAVPLYAASVGRERLETYKLALTEFVDSPEHDSYQDEVHHDANSAPAILDVAVCAFIHGKYGRAPDEDGWRTCAALVDAIEHRNRFLAGALTMSGSSLESWRKVLGGKPAAGCEET